MARSVFGVVVATLTTNGQIMEIKDIPRPANQKIFITELFATFPCMKLGKFRTLFSLLNLTFFN